MINSILQAAHVDMEKKSWDPVNSAFFRINIVVNGYGFSRDIKEQSDDGYQGLTRKEALAIVKKARSKGFEASIHYVRHNGERIA